jgi:hypothetical protein
MADQSKMSVVSLAGPVSQDRIGLTVLGLGRRLAAG